VVVVVVVVRNQILETDKKTTKEATQEKEPKPNTRTQNRTVKLKKTQDRLGSWTWTPTGD
jgi:hypothetical protein